jgi:ABC-type multidrug transport system permease subunit
VIPGDSVTGDADGGSSLAVPGSDAGAPGFTEAVLAGESRTLTLRPDDDGLSAQFHEVRVARAVYGLVADIAVLSRDTLAGVSPAGFRRLREAPRPLTLRVESAGRRETVPSGFSQSIPGTLVMFTMLVLLTTGSITLVVEREQGLLRRLAATPIRRVAVVLGKWASRLALGIVFIAFAVATGSLFFGMDWGRGPVALGALLVAWAAFNASLALLLAGLARTEAQASGIGLVATLLLAALGGAWWPIEITPGWMQTLAMTLPTGWAMDGLHRLVNFGHGAGAVAWHLSVLLAATAAVTVMAVRAFRYR